MGPVTKRIDERKLLILVGIGVNIVSMVVFMPIPGMSPPAMKNSTDQGPTARTVHLSPSVGFSNFIKIMATPPNATQLTNRYYIASQLTSQTFSMVEQIVLHTSKSM